MKHACPRCGALSISDLAVRWSDRAAPAACDQCGCLSHVLASTASGIFVGTLLILVAAMVFATGMISFPLAVSGACLSAAFNLWAWKRVELIPIPEESAANAKTASWLLTGIYAFLALFGP